jgi:putative endopeptidase
MQMNCLKLGVSALALIGLGFGGQAVAHPGHAQSDQAGGNKPADAVYADTGIELLFEPVSATSSEGASSLAAARYGSWGIDLTQRNDAIKPGDDFFRHLNGRWLDSFEIPADKGDYGSFNALAELSERRVKAIIEEAAANPTSGSNQQIGDLYASFMDVERLETLGLAPLQPDLDKIKAAPDARALAIVLAGSPGLPNPIGFAVNTDRRNTSVHQLNVSQSGLGLGERDFYLSNGSNFPQVRAAYRTYLETVLQLAGYTPADAKLAAARTINFEASIARNHFTRVDNRDPTRTSNVRTLAQLEAQAPGYPFRAAFAASGGKVRAIRDLNVSQPSAVAATARLWASADLQTLKDWAIARTLISSADMLPKAYRDARFAFQRVQTGQTVERARDKRGADFVDGTFGDALGQIYVAKHFPAEARNEIALLVTNVKAAMKTRIEGLEWMGPETKEKALTKLAAFKVKIGVPEVWDDTSSIRIVRDDLIGNARRAAAWSRAENWADLEKPVDKRKWGMTPQTVNAYYSPLNNEIVFPAAILQPPFFDYQGDKAVNYGAIGGVIGHEISHGFDDQGRRFSADGSQADWWTAEDNARFSARADKLVEQYNGYEPLPGLFVQGRVSLGENIADLAGLQVSHDAYKRSLGDKPGEVIDGLTSDQRFFLGWSQVWRFKARDERMRQRVATAPHSPPQFRVNGVVRNVDAWYAAFDVKPGDALYLAPEQRVRIW